MTLILGGARSGKSAYAQALAAKTDKSVVYVATAEAGDDEMAERIIAHQRSRPQQWMTLEAPRRVGEAMEDFLSHHQPDLLLLDCMTLLVSNCLMTLAEPISSQQANAAVKEELDGLMVVYQTSRLSWIIVSNEVGLGLVPETPLGRLYRDALGWVNQQLAATADEVIFMAAGLPMIIKKAGGL